MYLELNNEKRNDPKYDEYIVYWTKYINLQKVPEPYTLWTSESLFQFVWVFESIKLEIDIEADGSIFWFGTKSGNIGRQAESGEMNTDLENEKLLLPFFKLLKTMSLL